MLSSVFHFILSYILEIGSWHYEFCIEFWQRRSCGECKLYRSLAIWESTISTRAGNSLGGSINRIHHIGLQCPTVYVRRTLNFSSDSQLANVRWWYKSLLGVIRICLKRLHQRQCLDNPSQFFGQLSCLDNWLGNITSPIDSGLSFDDLASQRRFSSTSCFWHLAYCR